MGPASIAIRSEFGCRRERSHSICKWKNTACCFILLIIYLFCFVHRRWRSFVICVMCAEWSTIFDMTTQRARMKIRRENASKMFRRNYMMRCTSFHINEFIIDSLKNYTRVFGMDWKRIKNLGVQSKHGAVHQTPRFVSNFIMGRIVQAI